MKRQRKQAPLKQFSPKSCIGQHAQVLTRRIKDLGDDSRRCEFDGDPKLFQRLTEAAERNAEAIGRLIASALRTRLTGWPSKYWRTESHIGGVALHLDLEGDRTRVVQAISQALPEGARSHIRQICSAFWLARQAAAQEDERRSADSGLVC